MYMAIELLFTMHVELISSLCIYLYVYSSFANFAKQHHYYHDVWQE
jgi:hypothetical protein